MDSQEKDQDQQTPPTSPTTSDFEHGQHLSDSERLDSETQIPQSPSPAAAPSPRTSELECGQHWGDSERLDSETIRMSYPSELFSNILMVVPRVQQLSPAHWENSCETDHHDLPQVEFTKVSGPLDHMEFDEETLNDLGSDQRLLLEYVLGISRGRVNQKFASWKIGPLNHARWLTLAIRLMCLWTRGMYPSDLHDNLHQAIKFVVQVYAVSWFEIKRDCRFHNQQLYIFNMIQRIKQQSDEIQSIAFRNLKFCCLRICCTPC